MGNERVPCTTCLLLIVVIVGRGQEMAEDHLGDIDALLFVDVHWDTKAVVPNLDCVGCLQEENAWW